LRRSSFYYRSRRNKHVALKMRAKGLVMLRVRFGYPRLTLLLRSACHWFWGAHGESSAGGYQAAAGKLAFGEAGSRESTSGKAVFGETPNATREDAYAPQTFPSRSASRVSQGAVTPDAPQLGRVPVYPKPRPAKSRRPRAEPQRDEEGGRVAAASPLGCRATAPSPRQGRH
jgi:hypothetical protein